MILGGTGGIGEEVVNRFCYPNGNIIYYSYSTNLKKAMEMKKSIINSGNIPEPFFVDAYQTDFELVDDELTILRTGCGLIDHFINCIGILNDKTLKNMSQCQMDDVIDINVKYTIASAKSILPYINDGGSMTFISSIIGELGGFGQTQYAASKAAIEAFTKSLAMETARRQIRVNCVRPSIVDTQIFSNLTPDQKQILADRTLLKRMATTKEIADVIYFVATQGTYFDGDIIPVSGGFK